MTTRLVQIPKYYPTPPHLATPSDCSRVLTPSISPLYTRLESIDLGLMASIRPITTRLMQIPEYYSTPPHNPFRLKQYTYSFSFTLVHKAVVNGLGFNGINKVNNYQTGADTRVFEAGNFRVFPCRLQLQNEPQTQQEDILTICLKLIHNDNKQQGSHGSGFTFRFF